jgi:hypothetical protein
MAIPDEVASLQGQIAADAGRFLLTLADKECVRARTVVIASGARYRRLDLENLASFEGSCGTPADRSKPACPAYSRSATRARDRSSALRRLSGRAHRW